MGNCIKRSRKRSYKSRIQNRDVIIFDYRFGQHTYINFKTNHILIKEYTIQSFGTLFYVYENITDNILRRFTLRHKWNYFYRIELIDDVFMYFDTTGEEIMYYDRNMKKRHEARE